MKFRWLGFLVSGFAFILSFSVVHADCEWLLVSCTKPEGTGSNITFNTMEYSRSKYFWNTNECISDSDIGVFQPPGNPDDGILWRNQSINGFTNTFTDAECISFGMNPDPTLGCPCIEPTYVVNYVNGDNRMKESHFASARKCLNGSCNSQDPLGYIPGQPGYESVPTYEHALTGTSAIGEKIRVQVYSHDNATQQFPGDPNYYNYMAHDTDVKLSWNNTSHTAQGIVSSPDATPTIKTSPSITLPALPEGTHYEVVGVWHHYNAATSAGIPNYVAEYFTPTDNELSVNGTTATFNLGDHASCFGNVHRTYFDLEVMPSATPDFALVKTASPIAGSTLHPGDTITYSITAFNNGDTTLFDFSATDVLDPNLTFISGNQQISHSAGTVTLNFGDILAETGFAMEFIVEVNTSIPTPSQICNQAFSTNLGVTHSSLNICHNVTNPSVTDFSIAKSADPVNGSHVETGDTIIYTASVTNTGNTTLSSVTGTDTLNSNLAFVIGDAGVSHVENTVTIPFTNIAPGDTASKNFTVSVNSMPTPPWISNTFSATGADITKISNQTTHYVDPSNNPDFSLTKSANPVNGSHVETGDTIIYTASVTNTGNTTLSSVIGTDTLNSNLAFVIGDAGVSHVENIVTIQFTNIAPGDTASKNFTVSVNSMPTPPWISNTFSATGADITKTSNQTTHYVDPINNPDFSLTKTSAPETTIVMHPGEIITYSITAVNTGNTILPNFTATDSLNSNITFISGDSGVSANGQTITLNFGDLAVGENITKNFIVSLNTNISTPSQVCNQATATNSGVNNSSLNICHDVTDPITINFSIIKSANPGNNSTVTPGDTINYNLTTLNTGNTSLNNLILTDVLNSNLQYEGSTNPSVSYNASTHTISATFASIPANTSVSLPFTASVKDTATTSIGICNEAIGTANNLTVTSNSICHYIVDEEVSLTKTADIPAGTPVNPDQVLTYTISATNNTADSLNIIVTDPLDSLLQYIGSSNPNLTYDTDTRIISVAFDDVEALETVSTSFQAQILDPGEPNQEVCNEVSLVSATPIGTGTGTGGGNSTAFQQVQTLFQNLLANSIGDQDEPIAWNPRRICHPINIESSTVDFTLVKNSNPAPNTTLTPGDTISYTITATNTGTTTLNPLVITDVLNSNVEFPPQLTNVLYNASTHTVTGSFPNVSPGASVTAQFYVVIKDTATTSIGICNEAIGTASNLTVTSNSVCHYIVREEVSLAKTADIPAGTPVDPDQILTYTISATNNTVAPLNILVTDPLDSLLQFVNTSDPNLTYNLDTHTVSIAFNNVSALETVYASFQAKVLNPGEPDQEVCNEVSLVSTSANSKTQKGVWGNITKTIKDIFTPVKNLFKSLTSSVFDIRTLELLTANSLGDNQGGGGISAFIPERICHPITFIPSGNDLELHKTSNPLPGSAVSVGDMITYSVNIQNTSNTTLSTVILDQLDTGLSFFSSGNISSTDPNATGNITFDTTNSIINMEVHTLGAGESMTLHFIATVVPTTDDRLICNQAEIPDFQGNQYISEKICVTPSTEHSLLLEKTSDPLPNSNVTTGDTVLYKVRITNNSGSELTDTIHDPLDTGLSFIAPGAISSSDADATGTIVFDSTTSLLSLGVNTLGNGEWIIFEFSAEIIASNNGTQICNQAKITNQGQDYESENICFIVDNGGSGGDTFIEKSVSPTGIIANGDTLTYTIRFTSDEENIFSTTLHDTLDTHLIYIGNEIVTTSDSTISGSITHDGSATGGLTELAVQNLSQDGWIEFSFDALVENVGTSAEICNQAIEINGNWFSNIVCSSTEGGGGGGGGSQSISTIGICTDLVNGSVTCRKHTPHPSFGEEAYQIWKECKKNADKEELVICTHDWAAAVGLLAIGECTPDDEASSQTWWQWDGHQNLYTWPGDHNNQCNTYLEPCTPCDEIEATITKTTSTPAVAKEENAHYTTILSLGKTEPTGANIKITGIKVYDLTIPAESGWVYEHYMNGTSQWEWQGGEENQYDPAFNYFKFTGEAFDMSNNETFVIPYEMDTALTIKSDTAQVKNVAFAVIEYQIQQEEGTWSNPSNFYVGNTDIEKCQNLTILDIINKASTSTEGAMATVKIVRPFVEVRGGGNVGIQKLDDTTENPFGGLQTGGEFENTLSTGEILKGEETKEITETENLWDTYEGQTSTTEEFFGTQWQTTPDNSGVYFVEGNITLTKENAEDLIGTSKTFVIDGVLTIENNFEPEAFGAFIANKIIINKNVTKMTGIFIADTGNIISPEVSYTQLIVTGSLMGDATNLLNQRKFIGLHPEERLEPSIKINYDLRLLDATPPALELFLSEDWTQSTEE